MEQLEQFEGIVENIIFKNDENGYSIFSLSVKEGEDLICVGYVAEISEGEALRVGGSFYNHPTYGRQLTVAFAERSVPDTLQGMEKYLGSGIVKGIGAKLAKKIVKRFGRDTFKIIEEDPERLAEIKGITLEKAASISAVFHEQYEQRRAVIFMQEYGISPAYAIKIYKRFKENIFEIIKTNPYLLADEVVGIGFKIADGIASRVGIEKNSPFRIKAGIRYSLWEAASKGHVYLPREILLEEVSALLAINEVELIDNVLLQMQMDKLIVQEKIKLEKTPDEMLYAVYLNNFHYAENYVAKKLLELSRYSVSKPSQNGSPVENASLNGTREAGGIEAAINRAEVLNEITLADNQRRAVKEAMESGVLIITGGPGTGKTTTINTILILMKQKGYTIELAAPTGRAAKRMSEATGMEAKTIHRLLGIAFSPDGQHTYEKDEDHPIEAQVIIIDESSMVDIQLMYALLKAVAPGSRLILAGDVDQLPSVGPGNVLKDLITSDLLKVVRLDEIFRQARESAIVMNAHRINRRERPLLNEKNKDFFFVKRVLLEQVSSALLELVTERLPKYAGCDPIDIQVLTPMRKSPLGVAALNQLLQSSLNPPSAHKKEKEYRSQIFRAGDKVMQIKNNYNLVWRTRDYEGQGVFNGDSGVIQSIDEDEETLTVCFDDDRVVCYDFNQLEELELSYAITIHKSQGSEYKVVVIPVHSGPPMLMTKNLLYTAVTRAKELVVLVGIPDTLYRMVENDREIGRYTTLQYRLQKMAEMF